MDGRVCDGPNLSNKVDPSTRKVARLIVADPSTSLSLASRVGCPRSPDNHDVCSDLLIITMYARAAPLLFPRHGAHERGENTTHGAGTAPDNVERWGGRR